MQELTYTREFQPTVNDPACAAVLAAAASAVLGNDQVNADCPPITASEDFGIFARAVPGCFAFIGNGATGHVGGNPLHSRDYDFNDNVLPVGVALYTRLVQERLPA